MAEQHINDALRSLETSAVGAEEPAKKPDGSVVNLLSTPVGIAAIAGAVTLVVLLVMRPRYLYNSSRDPYSAPSLNYGLVAVMSLGVALLAYFIPTLLF